MDGWFGHLGRSACRSDFWTGWCKLLVRLFSPPLKRLYKVLLVLFFAPNYARSETDRDADDMIEHPINSNPAPLDPSLPPPSPFFVLWLWSLLTQSKGTIHAMSLSRHPVHSWSLVARMGALHCGSYGTFGWNTHYGVQSECSGAFSSFKPGPHGKFLKMYGRYRLSGKGSCPERGLETCTTAVVYSLGKNKITIFQFASDRL